MPLKRTTLIIDADSFKKLKSLMALKGTTITAWLKDKMREELGEK